MNTSTKEDDLQTQTQFRKTKSDSNICITTSVFNVSMKELFILSLFFLLLVYSVAAFLKHWNKNYRNVNYFPHFSQEATQHENGKQTIFSKTVPILVEQSK